MGVSLIMGAPQSGKTLLAIDIVREVLKDAKEPVLVLTDALSRWRRALGVHPNLTIQEGLGSETVPDLRTLCLIVIDSTGLNAPVIQYAQRGPVLITTNSLTIQTAFNQTASLILRIDRLEDSQAKITVVKSRFENGTGSNAVLYKVDSVLGLVAQDYTPPALKSAWDRLLDDEDLV